MIKTPVNKLVLGTVQFGTNYGISNNLGIPNDDELIKILNLANQSGVTILDSAAGYGNAETRIGNLNNGRFDIITKFSSAVNTGDLEDSISSSLVKLQSKNLFGCLAHNPELLSDKPFLWDYLIKKKEAGVIAKIGYSLYHPRQLEKLLRLQMMPDIIQVPFNLLDRKFEPYFSDLKKMGTKIHTRSVFLQGLFFLDGLHIPEKLRSLIPHINALRSLSVENHLSISELALAFVSENENIDSIVIGVASSSQLSESINSISTNRISKQLVDQIRLINVENDELLNPANWN